MSEAPFIQCDTEVVQQCAVVQVSGELGQATYATLRDTLLKNAIDQPRALIVDLSDATIAADTVLSVFTAVSIRISDWPSIPILVATGPRHVERFRRSAIRRYVHVHDNVATALAKVDHPPPGLRVSRALPNAPFSPHAARMFVRQTCTDWDLSETLTQDAVHIASELVQNTVDHTLSEARLRLELRRGQLTVAVGDDNAIPAVLRDPGADAANAATGILLVTQIAKSWGCITDPIGSRKTVWAVLGGARPDR